MVEETELNFTKEMISTQSKNNAMGFMFLAGGYLKEQGVSISNFTTYVGEKFSPGWEGFKGKTVKEITSFAALNWVSVGYELISFSSDEKEAIAVLRGVPNQDNLTLVGLTSTEFDYYWDLFHPIAKFLGVTYKWNRQDDNITISFSR